MMIPCREVDIHGVCNLISGYTIPPKLAYKIKMLKIEYLYDIGKRSVDYQAVFTVDDCQVHVILVVDH